MKMLVVGLLIVGFWNISARAQTDPCRAKALSAAEDEYGNDPVDTKTKTLVEGYKYRVAVGIGNEEDGEHDYYVIFKKGCSSEPEVSEVPSLPHPLHDAVHKVYGQIFSSHQNSLPANYKVAVSKLPAEVQKQYRAWKKSCATTGAFEIPVDGSNTFAITHCGEIGGNIVAGIGQYFLIFDSKAGMIDEATAYVNEQGMPDRGVGEDGISWQNMTFEQED